MNKTTAIQRAAESIKDDLKQSEIEDEKVLLQYVLSLLEHLLPYEKEVMKDCFEAGVSRGISGAFEGDVPDKMLTPDFTQFYNNYNTKSNDNR